ncbi:hypothetical protein SLEP1_g11598 [Rubroshorea leprosula]|nr:hypothetical protein SLEP1_g11598 [Rubroshorea leprosula]
MKMEAEIISKENIKPSSPTLERLKLFKPSFLDQLIPYAYPAFIIFYPMNNSSFTILDIQRPIRASKENSVKHLD